MIKLSILLPTYNRVNKFKELIEYLRQEKVFENERIQVLVSNNGSIDGTREYINTLNEQNLSIFNQKMNLGIIGNFRFLIENVVGEYIWIMGDNDYYTVGTIEYILKILDENESCTHVFLNYGSIGGSDSFRDGKVFHGMGGTYVDGLDMFYKISEDSTLGALMFISANIYRTKEVKAANDLVDRLGERDNLALPLGYSMYCSKGLSYCVADVHVYNEMSTPSTWSDSQIKVYCRDIIAMYDTITEAFEDKKELREFLFKNLPTRFAEYKYLLRGRKFGKSNYAMKFYFKYKPWKLVLDLLEIPIYAAFLGGKKFGRKVNK